MKRTGIKEVFIFIAGSTPQVITETIYALAVKNPPVYPDGIFIVTTCKGKVLASYYVISTSLRGYSNTRHGVRVEREKIRIEQ